MHQTKKNILDCAIRVIETVMSAVLLAAIVACGVSGTVQGGGTGNTNQGQLKIGVPF